MINIPLFKEQVESKLKATGHDMGWLAKQTNTNKQVLAMVLGRKNMKNSTPLLSDICDLLKLDLPRTDEPIKTDKPVPEPVPEEKPTLIDDMSEPLAEINEPVFWIDGQKYTKADVARMIEDSVADYRKIVELEEDLEHTKEELAGYEADYKDISDKYEMLEYDFNTKVNQHQTALAEISKLNKDLQELTDKYMAKDKEAIRLQVQVNTLNEDIEELRQNAVKQVEFTNLGALNLGDAIQLFKGLKTIFRDEVSQS